MTRWLSGRFACTSLIGVTLGVTGACAAGRTIQHEAPAESLPHLAWKIEAGPGLSKTSVACESDRPDQPCVLQASTAQATQAATLTVDLHAAAQSVSYTGTVTPTFLASPRPHSVKQEVAPEEEIKGLSIVDSVTSTPGTYAVEIELSATMGGKNYPIRLSVPVTVQ